MTLARLQHYNVVRYYTAWVENMAEEMAESSCSASSFESDSLPVQQVGPCIQQLFIQIEYCENKTLQELIGNGTTMKDPMVHLSLRIHSCAGLFCLTLHKD